MLRTLRTLGDDETMLVQSGKPVGVFRTHEWAPRVLIANSNLVPDWANWDRVPPPRGRRADDVRPDDGRLVDLHRHPGDPPGHVRVLRRDRPPPLRRLAGRHDHADRRARRDGRRPAAGDHDERRRRAVRRRRPVRGSSGASRPATSTRSPTDLDDAIARCTAARDERRGRCRSALVGNAADVAARGCSTSTSRPTSSPTRRAPTTRCRTCPSTSRRRRRPSWPAPTPDGFIRRARESMADALRGDGRLPRPRRRGLRLRQQPARRGRARRLRPGLRLPRLPAGLHPAAVLRGQGPVPLGRPVRRSGRHRGDRPGRARGVPRRRGPRPLDPPGRRAGRLPGPAGADLLARLRRAPPPRAALQRDGPRAASCRRRS